MTEENANLAAAIAALAAVINNLSGAAPTVATPSPILDPYMSDQPNTILKEKSLDG